MHSSGDSLTQGGSLAPTPHPGAACCAQRAASQLARADATRFDRAVKDLCKLSLAACFGLPMTAGHFKLTSGGLFIAVLIAVLVVPLISFRE